MARKRKERLHQQTRDEIKQAALSQMEQTGTGTLSLRAVAREIDLTPSALYYYYSDRDALITDLLIEAFTSLNDAVEAAVGLDTLTYVERGRAVISAYRRWALDNPIYYKLIYGNPIPGYQAPEELDASIAGRGLTAILGVLNQALEAGALQLPTVSLSPEIAAQIAAMVEERGLNSPPELIYLVLVMWFKLHGMVSLELYGQSIDILGSGKALFDNELDRMLKDLGFTMVD